MAHCVALSFVPSYVLPFLLSDPASLREKNLVPAGGRDVLALNPVRRNA